MLLKSNKLKWINITFYQKGHSCPSQQKKDLQNLIWLPYNLNYEVIKKSYFINFSYYNCSPCVLQCFMKILFFFWGNYEVSLIPRKSYEFWENFEFFPLIFFPHLSSWKCWQKTLIWQYYGKWQKHCQYLCVKKELLIIAFVKINLLFVLPWKFQVYLPNFFPFLLMAKSC